ncbi:MAG: glycosyltransferase family 39 protein [bacterium]
MNESNEENSSPSTTSSWLARVRDLSPGIGLGLAVFIILLATLDDPGVTWDEAYPNFPAAERQAQWFRGIFTEEGIFSTETIDKYWFTTSDHPSLPRSCAAFAYLIVGSFVDEIVAYRLPSAVFFSILVATVFFWCRKYVGIRAAWASALCLAFMPRVLAHAHIFSLDVPIMCWWIWTLFAVSAALDGSRAIWLAALVYAFAFATKLHSVFLPPLLVLWTTFLLYGSSHRKALFLRAVKVIAWAVVLVPIVYFGTQPWLWHDTVTRVGERFFDYARKTTVHPIGLWYLGNHYFNNTPWHYPLVMVLFTIPTGILLLVLGGLGAGWRIRTIASNDSILRDRDRWLLILLGALIPLLIVMLPLAQGYDGVRLFLPAFPCLAVLAGYGFQWVSGFWERLQSPRRQKILLSALVLAALLIPPCLDTIRLHPCQLAYYNALCGGLRGAQRLGLESTYWCDSLTKPFLNEINQAVPPGSKLRPLSMSYDVIEYWKKRGLLNPDIDHLSEPPYDFHLLQCRQGMFTTAEWYLYQWMRPIRVQERDGVPLFALYGPMPKR